MLVLDAYNKLATITGFPAYVNATTTPEITRFLLSTLSDALLWIIDNIYMTNNVLERTDTIITKDGQELYAVDGIIKDLWIQKPHVKRIPYNDKIDRNILIDLDKPENKGEPSSYVIKGGYLRLFRCPDKAYTLKVTLSTTSLVWANNDIARDTIESIDDNIMADTRFCNLVIMKAASLIFARLQNPNYPLFEQMLDKRMRTYIESDYGSLEAQRAFNNKGGHYNPYRGLLD